MRDPAIGDFSSWWFDILWVSAHLLAIACLLGLTITAIKGCCDTPDTRTLGEDDAKNARIAAQNANTAARNANTVIFFSR